MTEDHISEDLKQIQQLWTRLTPHERELHLEWTLNHCATCGREGTWEGGRPNGFMCDACCDEEAT